MVRNSAVVAAHIFFVLALAVVDVNAYADTAVSLKTFDLRNRYYRTVTGPETLEVPGVGKCRSCMGTLLWSEDGDSRPGSHGIGYKFFSNGSPVYIEGLGLLDVAPLLL